MRYLIDTRHRRPWRRLLRPVASVWMLALVSACANSVTTPVAVTGLTAEKLTSIQIHNVIGEAGPGVAMTPADIMRISGQVLTDIRATSPQVLQPEGGPQASVIKMHFTQYDEGNAFGRFMLAGLGQIHIDADVLLIDESTQVVVAKYQVAKDFSFGGLYGGTTTILDVEKGFAKSVAEIFKTKT